jgi:hypothetical protein
VPDTGLQSPSTKLRANGIDYPEIQGLKNHYHETVCGLHDLNVLNGWNGWNVYPIASAITPITIAPAPNKRRPASPSDSKRAPMAVPIRILISRAGAT